MSSEPDIPILLDRLLHASSLSDFRSSLSSLLDCTAPIPPLSSNPTPIETKKHEIFSSRREDLISQIISSQECTHAICSILSNKQLPPPDESTSGLSIEDDLLASCCELWINILTSSTPSFSKEISTTLLTTPPSPSHLTPTSSLLDLLTTSTSPYPRTLSLRILTLLHTTTPLKFQNILLSIPDSLNRLISLLTPSTPEEIRNESILLLSQLSKQNSAARKLLLFSEGLEKCLDIAELEGGIRGGVVAMDCLNLCKEMVEDCRDEFLSPKMLTKCMELLDCRRGGELWKNVEEEESLEELMGEKKKKVLKLSEMEEGVVVCTLELLQGCIEGLVQHEGVLRSVLTIGLFMEGQGRCVAAAPSKKVQIRALNLIADLGKTISEQKKEHVLMQVPYYPFFDQVPPTPTRDLLLDLCTRDEVGLFAVSTLRSLLSSESACLLILHAIAPPPDYPLSPIVKLLSTLSSSSDILPLTTALGAILTNGGGNAREMLLRYQHENTPLLPIFFQMMEQHPIPILRLFCEWCHDSRPVLTSFLSSPESVLLSSHLKSHNEEERGLASLLLGFCLDLEDGEYGGWSRENVLDMIQRIGVAKFTSFLNFEESLWKDVDLEYREYRSWLGGAVNQVRKRIVQELTKGEKEEEEGGLAKFVQRQSEELEEMQKQIDTREDKIKVLEMEIKQWRKRCDIADIQEEVEKEVQLEKHVTELTNNLETQKVDFEQQLKRMEEEVERLKKELEEITARKEELQKEHESMTEELSALSQAYSDLEREFHRSKGEEPPPFKEHEEEIARLKDEIERLTTQGVKADEWMAMAMERMNALAAQNEDLLKDLNSKDEGDVVMKLREELREEQRKKTDLEKDVQDKGSQLEAIHREFEATKAELGANKADLEATKSELGANKEDLEATKADLEATKADLEATKTKSENQKEKQIIVQEPPSEQLTQELQNQTNQITLLQETITTLQNEILTSSHQHSQSLSLKEEEIQKRDDEIERLLQQQTKLQNETNKSFAIAPPDELEAEIHTLQAQNHSLKEEVDSLQEASHSAQEWMAKAVVHHESLQQEVAYWKEQHTTLMEEMKEKKMDEGGESMTIPDQKVEETRKERDEAMRKIEELEKQLEKQLMDVSSSDGKKEEELMDKIEIMEEQLENLTFEKETAQQTIVSLKEQLDAAKLESSSQNVQTIDSARDDEITSLKQNITLGEEHLQNAQLEIQTLRDSSQNESIQVQNELSESKLQISSLKEEIQKLQDRTTSKDNELQLQNSTLRDQMEELQSINASLLEEKNDFRQKMEFLKNKCAEFQEWTKTAREKIGKLELERDEESKKCADLQDKCRILTEDLDREREDKEELLMKTKEKESEFEKLQLKLVELEGEQVDLTTKKKALEQDNEILEMNNNELSTEISDHLDEIADLQEKIQELSKKLSTMEEEIAQKNSEIQMDSDRISQLKAEVKEKEMEIANVREDLYKVTNDYVNVKDKSEEAINEYKERVEILESNLQSAETKLQEQFQDADHAISAWEERCANLQEQLNEQDETMVQVELYEREIKELAEEQTRLTAENDDLNQSLREFLNEKDHFIEELERRLVEKVEALKSAEEEVKEVEKFLEEMREQSEEVVNQWKERTEQLEANIADLEKTIENQQTEAETNLQNQHDEANLAIEEWEKQYAALKEQIDEQDLQLEESEEKIFVLENEVVNLLAERNGTTSRIDTLEKELDSFRKGKDELEENLEKEREELALEQKKRIEIEEILKNEKETWMKERESLSDELQNKMQSQTKLEETIKSLSHTTQEEITRLNEDRKALQQRTLKAESEMADIRTILGQLQGELKEKDEIIQMQSTDEVSFKATEMATEALRAQIDEIRAQYNADMEMAAKEREARIFAEQEMERLKSDFSFLAHAGDMVGVDGKLKKLASKAADEVIRKERKELIDLRSKLQQVMEELSAAKERERNVDEKYARARLHTSACEQELQSTKSDLESLQQTLEEMRESEMNSISTLQYRIEALEDECKTSTQSLSEEVENLKVELSQANAEKDRLLHSLQENERATAALVATDKMKDQGEMGSHEIVKLRLENARLLAASERAATKMERRIREALASKASSNETEIILERELRQKAEMAMDELQSQIEEIQVRLNEKESEKDDALVEEIESLQSKLEDLSAETKKLRGDNQKLKNRLEKTEAEAKESNKKLEKCRLAEARAREFDREGHFEAAVAAEVTRLRVETALGAKKQNGIREQSRDLISDDSHSDINENGNHNNMTADEMYDLIMELKTSVKEERSLYRDLLSEHEDLLSLLTQQDIERASLQSALSDLGGEHAVEKAMREAEETALSQFGEHEQVH